MIKKYIKTTPVEAIQVKPYNYDEVREFANNQNILFGEIGLFHTIKTFEAIWALMILIILLKIKLANATCAEKTFSRKRTERWMNDICDLDPAGIPNVCSVR